MESAKRQSGTQFDFGSAFLEGVLIALATIAVKASRVIGRIFFRVSSRGSNFFRLCFITVFYHAGYRLKPAASATPAASGSSSPSVIAPKRNPPTGLERERI